MEKLRLLLTLECTRNCSYCANRYIEAPKLISLKEARTYPEVSLTGGEPMLYPQETLQVAKYLKQADVPYVFLYSALALQDFVYYVELFQYIDGMHFTLHAGTTYTDMTRFDDLQEFLKLYPKKSFRLNIHPELQFRVDLNPKIWKRVELKPWLSPTECKLPAGEELFLLDPKEFFSKESI